MDTSRAKIDLTYFAKEAFNVDLFPWQSEVADHPAWELIVIKGRGAGGSKLGRLKVSQFCFANPNAIVLVVANAKHQILQICRQRLFDELQASKLSKSILSSTKESIEFTNGSKIFILPNSPESIRGYQPITIDGKQSAFGVVIEEACFIDNIGAVLKSVLYPVYNTDVRMFWVISSPAGKNSRIYELYKQGLEDNPDIKSWTFPSTANPRFEKDIEKIMKGKSEEEVKQEIEGLWVESSGCFFAGVLDCVGSADMASSVVSIGVDLSLTGSKHGDYSAIAVIGKSVIGGQEIYQLLELKARRDWSQKELEDVLSELYRKHNARRLTVEVYQGQGVKEALNRRGIPAELLHPTNEMQNMAFHKWRSLLENRQFLIPDDKALLDEMSDFTYRMTTNGKKTFGHVSGGHDDRVYACLYALQALFDSAPLNLDHVQYGDTREMFRGDSPYRGVKMLDDGDDEDNDDVAVF